jgi:hypothetical protein
MVPGKPPGPLPSSSMVAIGGGGLPFIACQTNAKARQMSAPELFKLESQALTQEDCCVPGTLFDTNVWLAALFSAGRNSRGFGLE